MVSMSQFFHMENLFPVEISLLVCLGNQSAFAKNLQRSLKTGQQLKGTV